jgi:DNA integrity scanning protein DisA with diadenylate cyclase activity
MMGFATETNYVRIVAVRVLLARQIKLAVLTQSKTETKRVLIVVVLYATLVLHLLQLLHLIRKDAIILIWIQHFMIFGPQPVHVIQIWKWTVLAGAITAVART